MTWNKKRTMLCLVLLGCGILAGCGKEQSKVQKAASKEVKIPVIFTVDPNSGEKKNKNRPVKQNCLTGLFLYGRIGR